MEQLTQVRGVAVPMLRININTDEIIPVPEILRAVREGYGPGLFASARYIHDRTPNPDFILNQAPWTRSVILLADRNFGCGSSREAAPKTLRGFGFRAIIAPSFSGIFYNNCFRNSVLPVELPIESVRAIGEQMTAANGCAEVTVDLETETVLAPDGATFSFKCPLLFRRMLLEGLDEIELTLSLKSKIDAHFAAHRADRPWAYAALER